MQGLAKNQAHLYNADDAVVANFEFESGVLGTGSWCYTVNKEQRTDMAQIIGATGKITFSFFEPNKIKLETADRIKEYDVPYPPHVQQPLLETIVAELRGEGKCPSNGESGARANLLMDKITAP